MPEQKVKPPRDELVDCREENMTLDEIATIYEVSSSTIKRWLRSYELVQKRGVKSQVVPVVPANRRMDSLLDRAKMVLGRRVTEHRTRGYFLDGRAVKADDLIIAAGFTPK
jgi:uncharacterized protein YjcR